MHAISRAVVTLLILGGLCLASHAAVAHGGAVTVHARTEAQIVNAMLAANSSGKLTIIKVAPGQYNFNTTFDSVMGPSLLPPITGTVLLLAHDPDHTVFHGGNVAGRILSVLEGGRLIVQNIALMDGFVLCQSRSPAPLCLENAGAAAGNTGGVLWLVNCFVSGNKSVATSDTGLFLRGGAIFSADGILRLENTTVTANSVTGVGGGIAVLNGIVTIHRSIIRGNSAGVALYGTARGGGIFASGAKLIVTESSISGHSGQNDSEVVTLGTGIYNEGGEIRILNSAVTENITPYGGAGGGIFNTGALFIQNSTIGGNTTGVVGGGIYNSGRLRLESVTLARNEASGFDGAAQGSHTDSFPPGCRSGEGGDPSACIRGGGGIWNDPAGSVDVQSSVIAENTFQGTPSDCNSALRSKGHNALGVSPDCHFENFRASDQINVDVRLDELQDNGEAGNAHYPLLANSPLIDAGGEVFRQCTPRDQIGSRRKEGDRDGSVECDVGAIEFRPGR